jgi:hypothetical protein
MDHARDYGVLARGLSYALPVEHMSEDEKCYWGANSDNWTFDSGIKYLSILNPTAIRNEMCWFFCLNILILLISD